MNTTETLQQESLDLFNKGNEMWKNKKFEDASDYYCKSIQKIMSSTLNLNLIPHTDKYTGTLTVFKEYKKNDSKFSQSTNAYTLEMIDYFIRKTGYFEGKNTFEKNFIKDIKKVHQYLNKELEKAKLSKSKNQLNPAKTFINALNNNGVDLFK